MSSNDLLSYSIMNKGHNVNSLSLLPLPMPSRPQGFTKSHNEKGQIVLPPLSDIKFNDYTTIRLTEGNLSNLNHSSPPSLTSSSASSSPVSSPSLSNMNLSGISSPVALANPKSDSASVASFASSPPTSTASESSEARKRRQRLGPSCDSCRTRKVKCDAEIIILSKQASTANLEEFFPSHIVASLLENKQVEIEESANVIISNDKLIKFKSCKSCNAKNLPCCFGKGFTKEDIMLNNKKKPTSISSTSSGVSSTKSKISKKKPNVSSLGSRKSSCSACRRRKIKCVFNDSLNKCEGCAKKDHSCLFENIN